MRIIISLIALMLSATISFAQNKNAEKTNAILKEVELLNADASYSTKTLNSEQFLPVVPGQSGQLFGYFKGRQLVKITRRIALPTCIYSDKYYLQNDSLIMFYRQERDFPLDEKTGTYNAGRAMTGMECRYYYDGNTVLKTDIKGEAKCSEKPSDKQAEEMMTNCQRYVKLLKK